MLLLFLSLVLVCAHSTRTDEAEIEPFEIVFSDTGCEYKEGELVPDIVCVPILPHYGREVPSCDYIPPPILDDHHDCDWWIHSHDDDDDDDEDYDDDRWGDMAPWLRKYNDDPNEMLAHVILERVITPHLSAIGFVGHDMVTRDLTDLNLTILLAFKVFRVTAVHHPGSDLLDYIDKYHMIATDAERNGWRVGIPRATVTTRVALFLSSRDYKYGWQSGAYIWISKIQLLLSHFNLVIEDIRMD